MKVIIASKGFTANEKQTEMIEKKFERLSKFFSDDVNANVTLGLKKGRQTLEAMIVAKGTIFRAEATDFTMNECLDEVVDRLSSQITKYKSKLQEKHKYHEEFVFGEVPEDESEAFGEEELKPVRQKRFTLDAMDVDEAILQMELLEHSFYVFLNSGSGMVNVVYKRNDGTYGLLMPEY